MFRHPWATAVFAIFVVVVVLVFHGSTQPRPSGNLGDLNGPTPTPPPPFPSPWTLETVQCYPQTSPRAKVPVSELGSSNTNEDTLSAYYAALYNTLVLSCGPTCDTTLEPTQVTEVANWPLPYLRRNTNCPALFLQSGFDAPAWRWPPPKLDSLPQFMVDAFTMEGRYPLYGDRFYAQRYSGGDAAENVWTEQRVNTEVEQARSRSLFGTYGTSETNCLLDAFNALKGTPQEITGKHFAVVGSERPWVESCLLSAGARHVTTIEYGKIKSEHPQISTCTPAELNARVFQFDFEPFDGVVTFSSLEHSGLGRYGDELNPWGDLIAMQRMWCVTKPNGTLVSGTVTSLNGLKEGIDGNLHRVYGELRYPYLTANWRPLFAGCGDQKVFAFARADVNSDPTCMP